MASYIWCVLFVLIIQCYICSRSTFTFESYVQNPVADPGGGGGAQEAPPILARLSLFF